MKRRKSTNTDRNAYRVRPPVPTPPTCSVLVSEAAVLQNDNTDTLRPEAETAHYHALPNSLAGRSVLFVLGNLWSLLTVATL